MNNPTHSFEYKGLIYDVWDSPTDEYLILYRNGEEVMYITPGMVQVMHWLPDGGKDTLIGAFVESYAAYRK